MERVPFDEVRNNLADVVHLVANARQRVLVEERGRDRAAFIPIEDLELLASLDGSAGKRVLQRVPLAELSKHLHADVEAPIKVWVVQQKPE